MQLMSSLLFGVGPRIRQPMWPCRSS
jgi:hypothetical protein